MSQTPSYRQDILDMFSPHCTAGLSHTITLQGAHDGDRIWLIGATHGNEPAGAIALAEFVRAVRNGQITIHRGTIFCTLGNPDAFRANVRYMETDLNRAFDTSPNPNTVEGARALAMDTFMKTMHCTAALDLHSVSIGNVRIAICDKTNPATRALAQQIAAVPMMFYYDTAHIGGTLMECVQRNNGHGIAVECGNHTDNHAKDVAMTHILSLLAHYEIIDSSLLPPRHKEQPTTAYETVASIRVGEEFQWCVHPVRTGLRLSHGDAICHDARNGTQYAPCDAELFMPSKTVRPTDTDAGFLCRRVPIESHA